MTGYPTKTARPSAEIEATLTTLRSELKELYKEEAQLSKRLEEVVERKRAVDGHFGSWGEIKRAESELELARLLEEAQELPKPVWIGDPYEEMVIAKVTKKRIYLRRFDSEDERHYSKNTGYGSTSKDWADMYGQIDVKATLEVWDKYQESLSWLK